MDGKPTKNEEKDKEHPKVRVVLDGLKMMRYGTFAMNDAALKLFQDHKTLMDAKRTELGEDFDEVAEEPNPCQRARNLCLSRSGWSTFIFEVDLVTQQARLLTRADHDREEAEGRATFAAANTQAPNVPMQKQWHFNDG
jgi:hypothetical protein